MSKGFDIDRKSTISTEGGQEMLYCLLNCSECLNTSLQTPEHYTRNFADPIVSEEFFGQLNAKLSDILDYLSHQVPAFSVQETPQQIASVRLDISSNLLRKRRTKDAS